MSWIDIFLADGDPHQVYGATAKDALSRMPRIRDVPHLWARYRRLGLPVSCQLAFVVLDVVKTLAYRKGFRDGASLPWPEEPL